MSLARLFELFNRCIIFFLHDFVQMHFILQVLVVLKALERLKHLLDHFLQIFDKRFVLNPRLLLVEQLVFLRDPLSLLVNNLAEKERVPGFGLDLALPQVYHLP